ncbi:CGNR zinc finger domain-containing protein [Kribbella sp. CA-253562]|uniref:CGNR zinc finger domain-containing protein n=1 Tax=Kribbella sp. CA-253562 TaxID=3239942 RepID=UPI003D912EEE
MADVPSWTWLEGWPALDFVNTVIRRGWQEIELIRTPADLDSWLEAAALPAPRPEQVTEPDVRDFLALRDPALRLLRAAAGHGEWDAADAAVLNEALAAAPEVLALGDGPGHAEARPVGSPEPFTLLLARLAGEVRDVLVGAPSELALCDAPGCGQLFFRRRPNQAWCGTPCGNRARVDRHHRKGPADA